MYDNAHVFSTNEKNFLEQKLIKYADTTSTQIVIATVNSLKGDDISLVSTQWAHKWGIGQKNEDNGIFILLSKGDRKIDISTGYGIEYRLTDLMAERIINQIMIPEFKTGNYFAGLDKGTTAIFQALNGEFKPNPNSKKENRFPVGVFIIVFIVFIIILSKSNRNNKGGNYRGGRRGGLDDVIIFSSGGRFFWWFWWLWRRRRLLWRRWIWWRIRWWRIRRRWCQWWLVKRSLQTHNHLIIK